MAVWLLFLLMSLATFRLTRLVIQDKITEVPRERVQEWAEGRWLRKVKPDSWDKNRWNSHIAYFLSCPWCVSIWIGGIMVLVVWPPYPFLFWLSMSAVTGLLATWESDE